MEPELAKLMNVLFDLGVKETDRTDIVPALLTGVPGLTQIGDNPAAADTLKINLGVAPKSADGNRFGVLANDTSGFPNGRRLADDVVDIELRVIGGFLLEADRWQEAAARRRGRSERQAVPQRSRTSRRRRPVWLGPKRPEPAHDPAPSRNDVHG